MLKKNAKLELMKSVPLFAECSKRELDAILAVADELDLPSGTEITKEGSRGAEFIVLAEGAADVRRNGRKIATLGSGDFVGEIALVTGEPRTATVTTTESSRLLVVTASAFRNVLRGSPSIQLKILEAVARRLPN